MEEIDKARKALKAIHDYGTILPTITPTVVPFNDYTLMISENDFNSDGTPMVEIVSNENLLKIYEYAVRCFDGDPSFDDFEGTIMDINGMDKIEDAFVDLFFALVRIDENKVCHVMDFEKYMNNQRPKLKLI